MKYCSQCGQKCDKGDVFCTNCGSKLDILEEKVVSSNGSGTNFGEHDVRASSVPRKMNAMCVVGFVCSFISSVLGLIFSIIGLCQIKENGEDGKAFAVAGIIISVVKFILILLLIILFWAVYRSVVYNAIYY